MRPSSVAVAAGTLATLCTAAALASTAPSVQTDFPCYLPSRSVTLTGAGFTPAASYTVKRDRKSLGMGPVDGAGAITGRLDSGRLPHGAHHSIHTLTVSDGTHRASVTYEVSAFAADFSPSTGDPHTLLVRFAVFGFAPGSPTPPVLYVHYVRPGGQPGATIRIGRTHGPCGTLRRTRRRRLFPFGAVRGRWWLQFDTHATYSPSNRPRVVRPVLVG